LLIGSLVASLLLVAAARLLGLGGGAISSVQEARDIAEQSLPGFVAGEAFVSDDGMAAVVIGTGGEYALIKQHGTQSAVRRLSRVPGVAAAGGSLALASGERMFGSVQLQLSPEERDKLLTLL
jgi:hypothetical protein